MAAHTIITRDPSGAIHGSRPESADDVLLALGAQFQAHILETDAIWARAEALQEVGTSEARKEANTLFDAGCERSRDYHRLLNAIRDVPATTLPGLAVKADAVCRWIAPGGEVPDNHEDGRVAWSLARDVLRLAREKTDPNPDAELIVTCDRYVVLERLVDEINERPATLDDDAAVAVLVDPIRAEQGALLDQLAELRASTPAGIHARTRALYASNSDRASSMDELDDMVGRQVGYLFRDVAALEAGAPARPSPASLDAELIAACAEFHQADRDQKADNADDRSDQTVTNAISHRWFAALRDIAALPLPATVEGRSALVSVAKIALHDQVKTMIAETFEEQASCEELVVMRALEAMEHAA